MAKSRDVKLAEAVAHGSARMVREYIAELRRQGRIQGNLFVIIKNGRKQAKFPFREV